MKKQLTRRDLFKATATTAVGLSLGGTAFASGNTAEEFSFTPVQRRKSREKVRIAVIGAWGRGVAHWKQAQALGEVVAICDIDAESRAKVIQENPNVMAFVDFREMIDMGHKYFDAVSVATPDHTHAVAAGFAMRAGKHVYCEKPLTRTVGEARKLGELARKSGVITQMGNQGTASDELRKYAAFVRAGGLGRIKEVHCWTNRPADWWGQGVPRPTPKPVPAHVNWDLWLGPSAERPYGDGYHAFAWRGWWDFGSGCLGDIGCHCFNLPFMALDLREPIAFTAETSQHNKDSFPKWSIIKYEFEKRGSRDAMNLYWYDGGKLPNQDLAPGIDEFNPNGCLIIGEKGTIYSQGEYGMENQIIGTSTEFDLSGVEFVKSPGHYDEWVHAIEGSGVMPGSNFSYSVPLTETVVAGNLAVWEPGIRVEWDARRMRAGGSTSLDHLIHPEYREGWSI